mgnify:CR=1 FL=1
MHTEGMNAIGKKNLPPQRQNLLPVIKFSFSRIAFPERPEDKLEKLIEELKNKNGLVGNFRINF